MKQLLNKSTCFVILFFITAAANAQQWRLVKTIRQVDSPSTSGWYYHTQDSTLYKYDYAANRGSSLFNDSIDYDQRIVYSVEKGYVSNAKRTTRSYNADNTLSEQQIEFYHTQNKKWNVWELDSLIYSNGKLEKKLQYRYLGSGSHKLYKFPTIYYYYNGKGELELKEIWAEPSTQARQKTYYRYDANGNNIEDSISTFQLNAWWATDKNVRTYNSAGKVTSQTEYRPVQLPTNPNLIIDYKLYNYYNAQGLIVVDSIQTNYPGLSSRLRHENYYQYNTSNQRVGHTSVYRDGTDSTVKTYTYTSFGKIDEEISFKYDDNDSLIQREKIKYSYEHYWPVNVLQVSQNDGNLKLYPNPASGHMTITWSGVKGGVIKGRIVNMQGQVQQVWEEETDTDYNKEVNTANLPNGTYSIELQAADKKRSTQFVILK